MEEPFHSGYGEWKKKKNKKKALFLRGSVAFLKWSILLPGSEKQKQIGEVSGQSHRKMLKKKLTTFSRNKQEEKALLEGGG